MSRFPSDAHLVSWAGICPRNDESAGKRRSNRLRKGAPWLKTTLVQCAWAAVKKKNSYHASPILPHQSATRPQEGDHALSQHPFLPPSTTCSRMGRCYQGPWLQSLRSPFHRPAEKPPDQTPGRSSATPCRSSPSPPKTSPGSVWHREQVSFLLDKNSNIVLNVLRYRTERSMASLKGASPNSLGLVRDAPCCWPPTGAVPFPFTVIRSFTDSVRLLVAAGLLHGMRQSLEAGTCASSST